ncbi:hypothetical protein A1O1_08852 [Capronia coronata CBS 617.96]|uniref:Zn(2)-C6 fungal-type domain-containing protein n=1 Tax=Capronia coronata CBS 617.96 TaxID=1182541 RepID=W9XDA4_9EURO|nr:uncharacterized protein A1O1_08852 [Capronia coronata CBS 617.96]EXJ78452.1 hypothetical protein A1O1_08852 [Capronia coronata CBS 617.96]
MDTVPSPRGAPQNHAAFKVRRRQLRRGTHSCWECKRRKMKCVFEPAVNATACCGCWRRGSRCLSQEFPEASAIDMEMVARLNDAGKTGSGTGRPKTAAVPLSTTSTSTSSPRTPSSDKPLTPTSSTTSEPPRKQASHKSDPESLSRFLYESLPSQEDTETIYKAIPQRPVHAHEMMTMPYTCLSQHDRSPPSHSLEVPLPNPRTHPVLIARHMLLLASLLQHLHPEVHADIRNLSEPPRAMSERLADLAVSHVTTRDELLGSIEGLDCIMIESVYQANLGNLRRSWVAARRALSVAQLMGLDRSSNRTPQYEVLDARTKHDPRTMWSRIVFLDRFLCLLLGLPQGCHEKSMSCEAILAAGLPMERLERIHCAVASRILERNESESELGAPDLTNITTTRTLDLELQKAARSVPSKWWLTPKLDRTATDPRATFWNTGRLFAQVLHYNLVNQLHLPYMLRSSSRGARQDDEFSRITCVNASREVLTRFITLRGFNGIASSCRIIDFLALMAAITLLLAHLDSHHLGPGNLLAHQYHSDRAMIEQVQDSFREVNSLNSDALSAHSADLLRRLLAIDADSTQGAGRVSVHKAEPGSAQAGLNDEGAVSVHIPYFGIIRITREGLSTTRPESQSNAQSMAVAVTTGNAGVEAPVALPEIYITTQLEPGALSTSTSTADYSAMHFAPQHIDDMDDMTDPLQHASGEYPGLAAGMEDWAFQGVDLAFFDSLMRTTGNGS